MGNNQSTTPKHPGGRPPKYPADKVVKCYISMTPAHHKATNGDRSGIIRRALDGEKYWRERCILAEAYIEQSPCDPDIYPEQWKAYQSWQEYKNTPTP